VERTFYHVSQESRESLEKASSTCEHIWLLSAGLTA
jgi:TetR/AcrR family transcriptional regulator, ethionamide resistance regulator